MAITLGQHKGTAGSPAVTLTFSSPTTTGRLLTLMTEINVGAGNSVVSVSNTGGATWTKAVSALNSSSAQAAEIWYGVNNIGQASDTITVTYASSPGYNAIYIAEWSSALVLGNTGTGTGNSATATASSVSLGIGDLIVAVGIMTGTTIGAGFTQIDSDGFSRSEYQIAGSSPISATLTGSSSQWVITSAAFSVPSLHGSLSALGVG